MKKSKINLSTIALLLFISLNYSVALADDIRIIFNEEYISINPSPIIVDGRTLVPARAISEMLGASVEWDGEAREVSIRMGSIRSALIIDSNIAVVNGHNIRIDVPAKIINGSTFIPLRFVAENFGFEIDFIDGVILVSERIEYTYESIVIEFGEIITTAMSFWDEWWNMRGRFSHEHIGEWDDVPEHLMFIYRPLLTTSSFENLNDIRIYLLEYYTEFFLETILYGELAPFVEYNNILYTHSARAGLSSTNWVTAIHTLLEQDGGRVLIQSSVLNSSWHMFYNLNYGGNREELLREAQEQIINGKTYVEPNTLVEEIIKEIIYHITLIEDRIDIIIRLYYIKH